MARTQQDVDREQERITDDNGDTVESALVGDDLELSYPTSEETIVDCARLDIPEEAVTALVGPNGSGKSTLPEGALEAPYTGYGIRSDTRQGPRHVQSQGTGARNGVLSRRRTTRSARSPSRTSSRPLPASGLFRRRHRGGSSGGRTCDRTGGDRPPPGVRTRPTERRSEATGLDRHGAGTGHRRPVARRADDVSGHSPPVPGARDDPPTQRGEGVTVAVILHDISQAARFADYLVAMCDGELYDWGRQKRS